MKIEIFGVRLPEIKEGDDIGRLICENFDLVDGDVVVVTSKIVSKSEGRVVRLEDVKPSKEALRIAKSTGKDARLVELILRNSRIFATVPVFKLVEEGIVDLSSVSENPEVAREIVERDQSVLITAVGNHVYSDAGIDSSNTPEGYVSLPPLNPMKSAERIRESIKKVSGRKVAVLISDTEVFLDGSIELCRGYAGICPVTRKFASPDIYGNPKWGGVEALAHEICCAASLLMGQSGEGIPVAVVRGLSYEDCRFEGIDYEMALKIIAKENTKLFGLKNILKFVMILFK